MSIYIYVINLLKCNYLDVSEFSPEKHIIENVKRRKYNTIGK